MRNSFAPLLAAIAISLLVAACGGGGGSSSNDAPPPSQPDPLPPQALFTLSGTVTASASQAVDGDTNDSASAVVPNDTVETAQPLANPITLGGYINQPGTGAPGRSRDSGDTDDYFRVELLAGQSITMLVADFQQADADLYLFDTRNNILDYSIEFGEIETLVAPRDGTYVVNVYAADGATNYILAIGNHNELTSQARHNDDIVPWQTVIKYRESTGPAVAATRPRADIASRLGMAQRAGGNGRPRLMALHKNLVGSSRAVDRLGPSWIKKSLIKDPALQARWETLVAIKTLARDPQIEYAEPNYQVRATAVPDDDAYPFQWHYPLINLPAAWDTTTGESGVIVAVVDTGILSAHPDLQGQWVAGYDFVSDPDNAGDGDGIDPDPEDPGDAQGVGSTSFHGTHVGGTVAAAGNNGLGVAGVAYSARIMPLRALGGSGGGTTYDVNQAIRFAAGLDNDSGTVPAQAATIINLSLSGGPFTQSSQELYREVRAAGVMVVAAAGNEATSLPAYPASYEHVIAVSAVDAQRNRATYSNTGNSIDIAAPGGDNGVDLNGDGYPDGILSTSGSSAGVNSSFVYSFLSGTSMAAPHVAGVLALMKSVNPGLTPADVDALLVRGQLSDDLGAPGRDDVYGYGLINAQRAVLAAMEAGGNPPVDNPLLSASAGTLNFGGATDTLGLELRNSGNGPLELLALEESEPWLELTADAVDSDGLGLYRVVVNRNQLASGVYAADITARSNVNALTIRVIMSVGGAGATADVGTVYILLYEEAADEPLDEFRASSDNGSYRFAFTNVAPGQYRIYAGSDADSDLFICDSGEACGSWLTTDQPITIELETDIEDINFPVDYLVSIPTTAADEADTRAVKKTIKRSKSSD
jgi:serine protease